MKILTRTTAKISLTILLACSLLVVSGCDSVLDISPRDELPEEDVWQDPVLVEAYLNDIYGNIGWGFGDPTIAGTADEAVNTHGHGDEPSRMSTFTPDNIGVWEQWTWHESIQKFRWERCYSTIRDINLFIQNVDASEELNASTKQTLVGEAHFLRAYFYHNLLRLFGGLPIIDQPFELGQSLEDYHTPRASFEETVEFIVSDLDEAANRLDVAARRPGAASQGAALALKSRVLLHAASDLFDQSTSPFPNQPEVAYQGGDQQQRWQRAKDAAQAVIDLGEYSLDPAPTSDEYHQLLVDGGGSETIWARYFNSNGGATHNHSLWVSPNGYNSWSGDTPTQEHVDMYENADGSEFSWADLGPGESPYEDRDPRLGANVLYNGTIWRDRLGGLAELDPMGVYQPGWYETEPGQYDPGSSEPRASLMPGLDTREGPNEQWNGTRSGYNMRKFVDRSVFPGNEQAHNPWIFLRYAEILLNYAEASAELGDEGDARMALNQVRSRVGMPDVTASGDELIDRIRNERAVELAYEEHRFFDVRRWMIAPDVYSQPAQGIRIIGTLDAGDPSPVAVYEGITEGYYDYEYEIFNVVDRAWNERAYFLPILRGEMNANPELVQNPGYD